MPAAASVRDDSISLRAIIFPGGECFMRNRHTWFLEKPLTWNINDYALESLLANPPMGAVVAGDTLHLVGESVPPWREFLDTKVLQIPLPRLQRLTIRLGSQLVILEKRHSRWILATPARAELDFAAFSEFLDQLQSLHFNCYLGEAVAPADANSPVDNPRFLLDLEAGRHFQRLAFYGNSDGGGNYLLVDGHSRFEMDSEEVNKLQKSLRHLRSRRILADAPQGRVDWLNGESGEHFLLQKAYGEEKRWGLLGEGKNGFELRESDPVAVQQLLKSLQSWRVKSFEHDNPQPSDLAAFGLDNPERVLTADSRRLLLSKRNAQEIYVLDVERKAVYRTAMPVFWDVRANALKSRQILGRFPDGQWQQAELISLEDTSACSLLESDAVLAEFQPFLVLAHIDPVANFHAKWRLRLALRHFDGEFPAVESVDILLPEIVPLEPLPGLLVAGGEGVLLSPSLRDGLLAVLPKREPPNENETISMEDLAMPPSPPTAGENLPAETIPLPIISEEDGSHVPAVTALPKDITTPTPPFHSVSDTSLPADSIRTSAKSTAAKPSRQTARRKQQRQCQQRPY